MARSLSHSNITTSTPQSTRHDGTLDDFNRARYRMELYSKASHPQRSRENAWGFFLSTLLTRRLKVQLSKDFLQFE